MIVSHEREFIFLKTRKTAGTSIEVQLAAMLGAGDVVTPVDPPVAGHEPRNYGPPGWVPWSWRTWRAAAARPFMKNGLWYYNHMPATVVRKRVGRRVWDRYYKFCFERDPWDKTLSWYFFRTRRASERLEFAEWVRTKSLPVDWGLYSIGDEPAVDFVGRYERLDSDLRLVMERIGLEPAAELPFEKAGVRPGGSSSESMYDAETSRLVERAFAREVALFGYRPPEIGGAGG